jgi:hypothetical protein
VRVQEATLWARRTITMKRHRTPASRWSASDRPLERRNERVGAVRCGEGVQLVQLRTEAGMSGGGGAGDERLGDRPGHADCFSAVVFGRIPLAGSLERLLAMDHPVPGSTMSLEARRPLTAEAFTLRIDTTS